VTNEFLTFLNSNGNVHLLFCIQNYIWLEQPRARCDDMKNHTRNGCKKIANPKSDYVTHEVSGNKCAKLFLSFNCHSHTYNTKQCDVLWCLWLQLYLCMYWSTDKMSLINITHIIYSGNILASFNEEIMIQFLNSVLTMLARIGGWHDQCAIFNLMCNVQWSLAFVQCSLAWRYF